MQCTSCVSLDAGEFAIKCCEGGLNVSKRHATAAAAAVAASLHRSYCARGAESRFFLLQGARYHHQVSAQPHYEFRSLLHRLSLTAAAQLFIQLALFSSNTTPLGRTLRILFFSCLISSSNGTTSFFAFALLSLYGDFWAPFLLHTEPQSSC